MSIRKIIAFASCVSVLLSFSPAIAKVAPLDDSISSLVASGYNVVGVGTGHTVNKNVEYSTIVVTMLVKDGVVVQCQQHFDTLDREVKQFCYRLVHDQ